MGVVKCMTVSSDGRHVALGGEDGSLTVVAALDMRTETSIRWIRPSMTPQVTSKSRDGTELVGHEVRSRHLAYSGGGMFVVQARSGDEALPDAVRDVDFSPAHQNRVVATTCEDGSCVLWEWRTRQRLSSLQLPPGALTLVRCSLYAPVASWQEPSWVVCSIADISSYSPDMPLA